MSRVVMGGVLAGVVVMLGGMASADEPPPMPLPPGPPPGMIGPIGGFVRPDPYAVWQNYGVDRRGHWRPLVLPYDDGLRYAATGEPYPFWQNHPRWITPMVANPATFGGPPTHMMMGPPPAPLMMGPPPVMMPPPAESGGRMPYAEK
jgi:hypothetical protein